MKINEFVTGLRKAGIQVSLKGENLSIKAPAGAVTDEIKEQLRLRKQELIEFLQSSTRQVSQDAIPVVDRSNRLPLSLAQQRLWLLDRIEPGSVAYNVPSAIRIYGKLDVEALQQALSTIFNRHEGLRAIFLEDGQGPYQAILPEQPWPLAITEIRADGLTDPESELLRLAAIELMTPFVLDQGPLFRARLFRLGEEEHVFSVVIHHIVTDGWSMGLLIRELAMAYLQISTQGESVLPPLSLQYVDFAAWQRARLSESQRAQMLEYWKNTLDQVPALHLPTDKPRPPVQTYNGASVRFRVPASTRAALEQLAQSENASLFMALLAAFASVLQRYAGQDDFAIGTPVAGRDRPELENLVGFFVNTVALRVQPASERSFRELLQDTRSRTLDGFAHQDIPFEQIVEALSPARDMSRSPLFQVMLAYQNMPLDQNGIDTRGFGDIRIEPFNPGVDSAKFDLTLTLWDESSDTGTALGAALQYNTDLFEAATIEQLCNHFVALADSLARQPDQPLYRHQYLSAAEREQQLVEWNLTQRDYDHTISVQQWFDQTAEQQPDAIAIRCGDQQLTYGELQQRSNQVAHYLIAHGVQPDDKVAIVLDRNLHLMTAILGVLKAGAAYVPLDASYPEERIRYILDNAGIQVGITRSHLSQNLPTEKQWIRWDEEYGQIQQQPAQAPEIAHEPERLLYVIFTSGSTGKPKGTGAYHRSEINLLRWYTGQFNLNPQDRLLLLSAVGFDLTQKNLFGALVAGATLVIPEFQEYDAQAITQLIEREQISWINCAPSAFYPLQDEPWQWQALHSLRYLFLGGEPINLARLAQWLRQSRCQLINSYGPTECTDIATWYAIDLERDLNAAALPIGRPNDNVRLYILGEQQELLPIGAIGELCIGGDGVGPGYLNNPGQTAAVFMENPYRAGERIYRTGDRVRYRRDGLIEYYGRRDHQMKLRGYRIEAGEIQAVLNQSEQVKDSLVDIVTGEQGQQSLVAWVVSSDTRDPQRAALQQRCRSFLPAFMVPDHILLLERFPLTPNGKVDRKALPKPQLESQREYVAPRTELEEKLVALWQDVLGVNPVGIHDNFFELGGQSLLATQLVSRIRTTLNLQLPIRELMMQPTIAELAQVLEQSSGQSVKPLVKPRQQRSPVSLSFGQQRLWYFEQMNPGTAANNMPAAFRILGPLDIAVLEKALQEIIRRHESLRTSFGVDDTGEPLQIIHEQVDWGLVRDDLSNLSENEFGRQLQQRIVRNQLTPFDLQQAPLLRVAVVIRRVQQEYYLLFCMHHIVSDGASMEILLRELITLYTVFSRNQVSPLPELRLQYADYAEWQRSWLTPERLESQLGYWRSKLADAPPLLELPLDKPRPAVQSTEGATLQFPFDEAFTARLRSFCAANNLTPFMFMLTAWKLLLSKYSGQHDIVVGVPSLGRDMPELDRIIGFFIHSFALRTRFDDNPTVADALQRVRDTVMEAFGHGDVPIDMLVEQLGIRRNPAYSPLVQVAFQLLDQASAGFDSILPHGSFGDIAIEPVGNAGSTAKFDITLSLSLSGDSLTGALEYNTALFFETTMQRLAAHYCQLCDTMLNALDVPLHTLALENGNAMIRSLQLDEQQIEQVLPLTAMQFDMFMDNQVNPASLQSSHGWHIHIHRPLDIGLWRHCLQQICDQQPMLRVRFVAGLEPWHEMGYLAVRRHHPVPFEVIDLRNEPQPQAQLERLVREKIYHPYDLQQDELIHYGVITLADDHHVVFTATHHAVLDGAALNSLWEQITARYTALQQGQDEFPVLPANYPEYIAHDRRVMDTADVLSFWREQFEGVEALDFTVPAPVPEPGHFITRERWLSDEHQAQLKRFCREQRITPALYLKSLFALMIATYCRPDGDFSIQETMGGRIKGHMQSLGCYIQEIPFIVRKAVLAPANTIADVLEYARQFQKTIKDQRLISIGKQLELSPRGRIGFMFNYYQFLAHTEFLGEVFDPEGTPSDPANNVQFVVTEVGGRLKFNLFYHGHLFADFGFLERIEALSQQILNGTRRLGDLQFVTEAREREQLLHLWNNTHVPFDLSLCIHQRFERQVEQHPERIAVADDQVSYSYAELNRRANQLAHYLRQQGVDRNDLVGLCAERSADFLVGILGIMKAGAAYVPMDARYPQDRIDYMIQNSDVAVLLTQAHLLDKVGTQGRAQRLCLDRDWPRIAEQPDYNPAVAVSPRDRAYMLYTSGSTGLPKGAIIRHDGAMNHIEAERQALEFSAGFNFLQSAPASSDISVWQFVGPVTCGGKTVILDDVTNAPKLFRLVREHELNLVELVPVALQLLMEHVRSLPPEERALPSLRYMMATGEAVSVALVNDWLALYPDIPVVNAYGPTEAADDVIQATITQPLPSHSKSVPIGRPLANLSVYILDEQRRLLPAGVPGEICIGGIGVGEGYWRNEDKTADAFIPNPFTDTDERIYRTGDLGRWLADGTVEYLDRVDNQVKVRGFRIELGEVEAVLSAQPGVREAAVIVRHDMPGGVALAGYVTADEGVTLSIADLRSGLRARLPDFMVPTALMIMERMPLTPAGKIDRRALPRPDLNERSVPYVAPRNELEHTLASIWSEVLHIRETGIHDNFFDIGGHSLAAVRIVSRIQQELGVRVPVATLITEQTIANLARAMEAGDAEDQILVPLARSDRPPLFLIHPIGGDVLCYGDLAHALRDQFSVYALRAQGLDGQRAPVPTLEDLVAQYVHEIRRIQPAGPYRLGGQSLGGIFALAIARQLEQQGETVQHVIMLDTFAPDYLRDTARRTISQPGGRYPAELVLADAALGSDDRTEEIYPLAVAMGLVPADVSESIGKAIVRVVLNNHRLALQAEVGSLQAAVHHFTAQDNPVETASGETWQAASLQISFHTAAGGHESMMQGAHATTLARMMAGLLS